jgi:hypothetical protein
MPDVVDTSFMTEPGWKLKWNDKVAAASLGSVARLGRARSNSTFGNAL